MISFMLTTMMILMMMNHPLALIMGLIMISIMISIYTFILTKMSLMSMMIMLVLLGGLIILFIYMASLAPNEPFKTKMLTTASITIFIMNTLLMWKNPMTSNYIHNSYELSKLFNNPIILMLITSYLFITLVAIVKITTSKKGPLRTI